MTRTAARLALAMCLVTLLISMALPARAMKRSDEPGGGSAHAARPDAPAIFPPVAAPDPVIAWMANQVDHGTLYQYTGDLSGEWPVKLGGSTVTIKTRHTQSGAGIQNATNYAKAHLEALGLFVEAHRWGPETAPNIIGQKTGQATPRDIYLIGAHLDDMPTGSIAPGADDNASGSVAVLVAADILSQFDWKCTLRFALWTGEEQGLLGSDKYAQRAKTNGETIKGVLNLDMIGWNTAGSEPELDLYADGSQPATVELANQAASVINAYGLDLAPEVRVDATGGSDHASFWKYGYTAILGIEDYHPDNHDFNRYYHTPDDQLEMLDMAYYTEFVKAMVAEMAHMTSCLVTGSLAGHVTASHDGSPIADAEVTLTDTAGRSYILKADASGAYNLRVPPETYVGAAETYGYGSATTTGLRVAANGILTVDYALSALPPAATTANAALDGGEVKLTWLHASPNTAYVVRRDVDPYFDSAEGDAVATLPAAHAPGQDETLSWRDANSGAGHTGVNHFYIVVGQNASGAGATSNRTGEFDFALATE